MNIRILPADEYEKLPIEVNPATSVVAVAEDVSGEIKGYWVAQAVVHIEPVHLNKDIRDSGFTGLRMLQTLLSELALKGDPLYYAFSDRPEISDYLSRLGLSLLPYQIWLGVNPLLVKKE